MHRPAQAAAWSPARANVVLGLFAVLIFLNATLLFVVQPMFTKMVLPLLGGTPAVWNTCLMFFQAALLVGYLYAHLTSRRLSARAQGLLHLGVMLVALLTLPLVVRGGATAASGASMPILWLLGILTISLGLPFVLLAAGAPMFQRWLASTSHPAAANPYVLYIASNLGSFVALLAYPTLIEPRLTLSEQRLWWTVIYVSLLALVGVALWLTVRLVREREALGQSTIAEPAPVVETGAQPVAGAPLPEATDDDDDKPRVPTIVPTSAWRLRWVLLSFAPSSLLVGVTTYLSTDVAAIPLLWVVPLALYLLTFVLVFAERPLLNRMFMLVLQVPIGLGLLMMIGMTPLKLQVAFLVAHLLGFFVMAMVCHRELADSRPRPEYLTEFYLWMSVGGLLGGVFNVVIAPLIYDRVLEYPLAVIIAFGLRPSRGAPDNSLRAVALDLGLPLALYGGLLAAFAVQVPTGRPEKILMVALFLVVSVLLASFYRRPLRLALGAAALYLAVDSRAASDDLVYQERSFFGVYRVHKWGDFLVLQHGTTTHGAQSLKPELQREPLTYYARMGPLGDAFDLLTDSTALRNVALVGLGSGTTACYARPFEIWTYYEIDPAVVRMSTSGRYFTYMKACGPNHRIEIGDARVSLQAARNSSFDLIALDAFSSDAIPVHLMTREALQLYLRKLKPNGSILFHISNRYLDLEPVVQQLARDAHLASAARDFNPNDAEKAKMIYGSRWIALSRESITLAPLVVERSWRLLDEKPQKHVWTDDYSDVVGVLKRE
jgi:SAM-dependent methyltransferase